MGSTIALPLVFGNSQATQIKETEIERDRLYQKVGKLQVELDWLKKKHRAPLMSIEEKKQRIQPRNNDVYGKTQSLHKSGLFQLGSIISPQAIFQAVSIPS